MKPSHQPIGLTNQNNMSPDKLRIQELEKKVDTLTNFMMSFENNQSVAPNHALTIRRIVGATRLADLEDVSIPSPSSGQVLEYNGSVWVAATDNV